MENDGLTIYTLINGKRTIKQIINEFKLAEDKVLDILRAMTNRLELGIDKS